MQHIITQKDGLEKAIKLAIKEQRFQLTEPLENVLIRYQFAYDKRMAFLRTGIELYKVRFDVVEAIVKEYGVSIKQAYLDYANASKLLDNAPSITKKEVSFDMQIEQIEEDMMLCRKEKDLRSLSALHKVKADLLKNYPQANIVDWLSISFPQIRAIFRPELLNTKVIENPKELQALNEKLKAKYKEKSASEFINSMATDVEYTETRNS